MNLNSVSNNNFKLLANTIFVILVKMKLDKKLKQNKEKNSVVNIFAFASELF